MIDTWGSTSEERAAAWPCDRWLPTPDRELYRAVTVDASSALVFRWLCQLRAAPYSYDWLDNRGRRSPRHLDPGLDDLRVGQRFMSIFELVDYERDAQITIVCRDRRLVGDLAVTYRTVAVAPARTRLVVKLAIVFRHGVLGRAMRWVLPAGDLLMMRKQLLTLKALAEATSAR